jgi:hypothetical protein
LDGRKLCAVELVVYRGIVPIGFVWKEKVITFSLAEWRRGLGMLGWIVGGAAVSVFEGGLGVLQC